MYKPCIVPQVAGIANPTHITGFLKKGLSRSWTCPCSAIARGTCTSG
ncbi:MAG: hypothetical protein HYW07_18740 [Candidatus Latescibacteria bacterium]|nr:hypothetical protein [Candidatus Latescibacterota bacterium]